MVDVKRMYHVLITEIGNNVAMKARNLYAATVIALLSTGAAAEWVRVGENARSVAYVDTAIKQAHGISTVWTMFSYKSIQVSPQSGRQYLSEKGQREVDCHGEKMRTVFFTWHAGEMGSGVVTYTGRQPTHWEPTSAPGSYGNAFWKYVCIK